MTATMDDRLRRLAQRFRPGERVRAVETIFFLNVNDEIAEGTVGYVQQTHVLGCAPLVTVAWDGRGRAGEPPHITEPCSVESLEPAKGPVES